MRKSLYLALSLCAASFGVSQLTGTAFGKARLAAGGGTGRFPVVPRADAGAGKQSQKKTCMCISVVVHYNTCGSLKGIAGI
jgi:hypothetical protein